MGPRPPIKAFEGRLREDDIHLLVDYARINKASQPKKFEPRLSLLNSAT